MDMASGISVVRSSMCHGHSLRATGRCILPPPAHCFVQTNLCIMDSLRKKEWRDVARKTDGFHWFSSWSNAWSAGRSAKSNPIHCEPLPSNSLKATHRSHLDLNGCLVGSKLIGEARAAVCLQLFGCQLQRCVCYLWYREYALAAGARAMWSIQWFPN